MKNIQVNGYDCFAFDKGIYSFKKQFTQGWSEIQCSEKQLNNGDIEYMTEQGITLDKAQIRKIQKAYKPILTDEETYPNLNKIATELQQSICRIINSISLATSIDLKEEAENARYPRQCILEMVIAKLEKCV